MDSFTTWKQETVSQKEFDKDYVVCNGKGCGLLVKSNEAKEYRNDNYCPNCEKEQNWKEAQNVRF